MSLPHNAEAIAASIRRELHAAVQRGWPVEELNHIADQADHFGDKVDRPWQKEVRKATAKRAGVEKRG